MAMGDSHTSSMFPFDAVAPPSYAEWPFWLYCAEPDAREEGFAWTRVESTARRTGAGIRRSGGSDERGRSQPSKPAVSSLSKRENERVVGPGEVSCVVASRRKGELESRACASGLYGLVLLAKHHRHLLRANTINPPFTTTRDVASLALFARSHSATPLARSAGLVHTLSMPPRIRSPTPSEDERDQLASGSDSGTPTTAAPAASSSTARAGAGATSIRIKAPQQSGAAANAGRARTSRGTKRAYADDDGEDENDYAMDVDEEVDAYEDEEDEEDELDDEEDWSPSGSGTATPRSAAKGARSSARAAAAAARKPPKPSPPKGGAAASAGRRRSSAANASPSLSATATPAPAPGPAAAGGALSGMKIKFKLGTGGGADSAQAGSSAATATEASSPASSVAGGRRGKASAGAGAAKGKGKGKGKGKKKAGEPASTDSSAIQVLRDPVADGRTSTFSQSPTNPMHLSSSLTTTTCPLRGSRPPRSPALTRTPVTSTSSPRTAAKASTMAFPIRARSGVGARARQEIRTEGGRRRGRGPRRWAETRRSS